MTTTPETSTSPREAGPARDRLLAALLSGPRLDARQHRQLVGQAQQGACAAALLELGVVDPAAEDSAREHATAGVRARNRLLESLLAPVVDALAGTADPSAELVESALEGLVRAIARADPDRLEDLAALAVSLAPAGRPVRPGGAPAPLTDAHLQAVLDGAPLDPTSRDVLALRFGLSDGWARTLEETAAALGLTREQVRITEARLLARLRRHPSTAALRRPRGDAARGTTPAVTGRG